MQVSAVRKFFPSHLWSHTDETVILMGHALIGGASVGTFRKIENLALWEHFCAVFSGNAYIKCVGFIWAQNRPIRATGTCRISRSKLPTRAPLLIQSACWWWYDEMYWESAFLRGLYYCCGVVMLTTNPRYIETNTWRFWCENLAESPFSSKQCFVSILPIVFEFAQNT